MTRKIWRLTIICLIGLAVLLAKPAGLNAGQEVAIVSAATLNVRTGPGTNFNIVAWATKGDKLAVLQQQGDWYQVTMPGGEQGWVARWLVETEKISPPAGQTTTEMQKDDSQVVITDSLVNVRSGPGTSYSQIARLEAGDMAPLIGQEKDWFQILLPDNRTGWVAAWLSRVEKIETIESAQPVETKKAIVTGTYVNIRSGPGTNFEQIGRLHQGEEKILTGQEGDWYRIELTGGVTGWIAGWLVEVKPDVVLPVAVKPPAGKSVSQIAIITADIVNVRDGAGTIFPIFSKIKRGEQFNVTDQERDWLRLDLGNGNVGWIAGWLAEITEQPLVQPEPELPSQEKQTDQVTPPGPINRQVAVVTGADIVNVRSGSDLSFERVARATQGQEFQILKEENGWFQVQVTENQLGWIAGWLVTIEPSRIHLADRGDSVEVATDLGAGGDITEPLPGKQHDIGQIEAPVEAPVEAPEPEEVEVEEPNEVSIPEHLSQVDDVLFGLTGEEGQLVVKANKSLQGFNVFSLREPNRIVIDLEGAFLTAPPKSDLVTGDTFIQGIRYSQFSPETVRVVLDLAEPAAYTANLRADGMELVLEIFNSSLSGKVIVIDPGHGEIKPNGVIDPGAIGPSGLQEREVVTDISHRLKKLLEAKGANVALTRTGDTTNLSLQDRGELANNLGADIFVSVHANASLSPRQNGTSVFYYAPTDSEFSGQRADRRHLAQSLQNELLEELKLQDMGIIEKNFAVLRHTNMPSALVEVAFISYQAEEKLLADPGFRQRTAEAIMKGIMEYFAAR